VKNRRRAEFSLQMNLSNDREDDLPLNKTGGLAAADICASEAVRLAACGSAPFGAFRPLEQRKFPGQRVRRFKAE
jgi:hypothetical protein